MSSKFSANKKTVTQSTAMKKEEVGFWKKSIFFFIIVGVIMFIMSISSSLIERQSTGKNIAFELYKLFRSPLYIGVVLALFAASLVWVVVTKLIKRKNESLRYFSSVNAVLIMLYVVGFSVYFGRKIVNSHAEVTLVLAVTVGLAVVYYVSKMYNPDFLAYTVETFLLLLLLYKYWHVYTVPGIVGKILLIVAFAAVGAVILPALKKHTSRAVNNRKISALCYPYWISLVLWAAFMFIKINNPTGIAVINVSTMLTILLVQYIVFAIVYTIRLIRE